MCSNETKFFELFAVVAVDSASHDVVVLVGKENLFPQLFIGNLNVVTRRTAQILDSFSAHSSLNDFEVSVQLGPSFFEDHDPQLGALSLRVARAAVLEGKVVVNNNHLFDAVFAKNSTKDSCCIHLVSHEQVADPLFFLSQTS